MYIQDLCVYCLRIQGFPVQYFVLLLELNTEQPWFDSRNRPTNRNHNHMQPLHISFIGSQGAQRGCSRLWKNIEHPVFPHQYWFSKFIFWTQLTNVLVSAEVYRRKYFVNTHRIPPNPPRSTPMMQCKPLSDDLRHFYGKEHITNHPAQACCNITPKNL